MAISLLNLKLLRGILAIMEKYTHMEVSRLYKGCVLKSCGYLAHTHESSVLKISTRLDSLNK